MASKTRKVFLFSQRSLNHLSVLVSITMSSALNLDYCYLVTVKVQPILMFLYTGSLHAKVTFSYTSHVYCINP